ncbi:tRNA-specific adenosine deaminase [Methylacidiphilum sp. Yel]|uniref:nucleoside deaminase n=1 Tax=Methylacidiphilum sp. Yel TaxID=1847730 RepID=UPI001068EC43|nr:nucleoside deaminase [Methylacidiphilum sp. Yel]TFE66700.1 tRNA-specific adenosine deaminase [Methylacidiphilum sp. Yel]
MNSHWHQSNPFWKIALEEAKIGFEEGGIPIGACLAYKDRVLGRGRNRRVQLGSVIRHGEMDCLENAGRYPPKVYHNAILYTTLSPCWMCTGAILLYGIKKIVIGENHNFKGPEEVLVEHGVEIIHLDDEECKRLLTSFIASNPELWFEDIGKITN